MIAALLPVLGPLVGDVVKRILPEDKDARMKVERELNMALMQNSAALEQAAASVIKAEAESEHKITATWRPVLMLTITAIVGWNYLLRPWSSSRCACSRAMKYRCRYHCPRNFGTY